ncbi:MAG: Hsp20/alpha crystallin family protein [Ruminococcus sp.]|jgi:HSP20 family protein|nr:Hsp20/alpha crystallin family protein [Ruminococcus sp.]MBR1429665.1 Hsp20/alpha crystallin family protein [Ruminococcus sp.]MBR3666069.1 Hsp20/alpha crystallin family protein [Ruminococcus sp.]MBR6997069.1 Hsp20/alpha crystallin family protein [Ruminococcus sp.]
MYGLTPFGRTGFGLWDAFNDFDKNFFGDSMPINSCRTDIRDDGDKYVMESELPGFEKEDIKLDINGTQLTIAAEHSTNSDEKDEKGNYIRRERTFGSYKRSFDVSDVDTEAISAAYKNGILTLELPKKKPEEPVSKRLEIK